MSDTFVTPWAVALQASLSMGFSRQECWSELPFSSPGDLSNPGIEPWSPVLAGRFFTTEPLGRRETLLSSMKESESESEVASGSCEPMNCNLPGFSIHGIFQARILEWVVISFSRRSSRPGDWTQVSCIVGRCFTIWATRELLPY